MKTQQLGKERVRVCSSVWKRLHDSDAGENDGGVMRHSEKLEGKFRADDGRTTRAPGAVRAEESAPDLFVAHIQRQTALVRLMCAGYMT